MSVNSMVRRYQRLSEQLRIVSCAMAAASFLLLSFCWAQVTGDSKYDVSEYRNEVANAVYLIENMTYSFGKGRDLGDIRDMADSVLDGKLTGFETYQMSKGIGTFASLALDYEEKGSDAAGTLWMVKAGSILYQLAFLASILSGIAVLWYRFQRKVTVLEKPFFISRLILFSVTLVAVGMIKGELGVECGITLWSFLAMVAALPVQAIITLPVNDLDIQMDYVNSQAKNSFYHMPDRESEVSVEKKVEKPEEAKIEKKIEELQERVERLELWMRSQEQCHEIKQDNTKMEQEPLAPESQTAVPEEKEPSPEFMFCTNCGRKIGAELHYCIYCGQKIEL